MSISVLIPVYNGERYLAEALRSVLDQTHPVDEILVLDDGSEDRSADIAKEVAAEHPMVRVLPFEHRGKCAAMNDGIAEARGDWVAFLDADDLWHPEKIALQVEASAAATSTPAVYCFVQEFISPDLDPELAAVLRASPEPLPGHTASAALVQRALFSKIGGFDETLTVGEFIDWYARAQDAKIPDVMVARGLVRRRLHESNMGRSAGARPQNLLPVLRQVLARRRAAQKKSEA